MFGWLATLFRSATAGLSHENGPRYGPADVPDLKPYRQETRYHAPHCDSRVLHRPGRCKYCDGFPEWQRAREVWGVNFTGEDVAELLPCPATRARAVGLIYRWPGNRPEPQGADSWARVKCPDCNRRLSKCFCRTSAKCPDCNQTMCACPEETR